MDTNIQTLTKGSVVEDIKSYIVSDIFEGEDRSLDNNEVLFNRPDIDDTDMGMILQKVEDLFDLDISDEDAEKLQSINDFADYVLFKKK